VLTSVEPERAARGACPHVMSEAGRTEGSEPRLVLKSCTRRRGVVDVCSASIDGGPVCCKRSHLPVQPVKLRDAVDQRPVIPAPAIDQLRATESLADGGFQWTIQSFDRSRSATRRAISAGASSGIGNTELTLISPST